MSSFASKIGIPLRKAWVRLLSPPCSGVGVLELGERFIHRGFSLGENLPVWLGAGMSRGLDPGMH